MIAYRFMDESLVLPICLHGGTVSLSWLPALAGLTSFEDEFGRERGVHARFLRDLGRREIDATGVQHILPLMSWSGQMSASSLQKPCSTPLCENWTNFPPGTFGRPAAAFSIGGLCLLESGYRKTKWGLTYRGVRVIVGGEVNNADNMDRESVGGRMHTAKLWHLSSILSTLVLLSACIVTPTALPVPTDTPGPTLTNTRLPTSTPLLPTSTPHATHTPAPRATLEQGAGYEVRAWVAFERPGWDSAQTVFVKLTKEDEGVAGAQMYCIVRYGNTEHRWPAEGFETTKDNGIAAVSFGILNAGLEGTVPVDVYIAYDGETFHSVTSFMPRC